MGIRITKTVGYGFTDLVESGNDPRFNPKVFKDYEWLEGQVDDFLKWVERSGKDAVIDALRPFTPYPLMAYQIELEDVYYQVPVHYEERYPRTLVMTPFADKIDTGKWHRYNDALDHYAWFSEHEEDDLKPVSINLFKERQMTGLNYFSQRMLIKPHKIEVFEDFLPSFPDGRQQEEAQRYLTLGIPIHIYRRLVGWSAGFSWARDNDDLKTHLLNDWTPQIPSSILLFSERAGIFTDFKYAYDMHPVMYTRWT